MPSLHKTTRPHRRRRPTPSSRIVAALRARILDGTLSPGQRLPTHVMIEDEFQTTSPTVAKAIGVLRNEGFIRSERRRGMFVTQRPPHRHHYALAMAFGEDEHLSHFYVALRNEAARFESSGRHFSIFYNIAGHTDTEDYQRLLRCVHSHQLAGLIFAQAWHDLAGSPLLEEPGIPRVVVATGPPRPDGIPAVYPDISAFLPTALEALAAGGRRRVAMITVTTSDHLVETCVQAAAERGMICRPRWIHAVDAHIPHWASNIAQLLMRDSERPDAMVILDDNVVEHATAGIRTSGVRVPEDIEIIAHANFPWPTPSAVPVRRLGYNVRDLLEMCVARVEALRRGEQSPQATLLPALFEEELVTRKPTAGLFPAPSG